MDAQITQQDQNDFSPIDWYSLNDTIPFDRSPNLFFVFGANVNR